MTPGMHREFQSFPRFRASDSEEEYIPPLDRSDTGQDSKLCSRGRFVFHLRQPDREPAAVPWLAFHRDLAAMRMRNRLGDAEAEANVLAAAPRARLIGPIETVEDMR